QPAAAYSRKIRSKASSESPLRGTNLYSICADAGPLPPPPPVIGPAPLGAGSAKFDPSSGCWPVGRWAEASGINVVTVPAALQPIKTTPADKSFVRVIGTSVAPRARSRTG